MITVVGSILSGNLGNCWINENDAANALADFTKHIWEKDLQDRVSDQKISIDLKILYNTCGYHSPVFAMDDKGRNLTHYLTDENIIWEKFCDSEIAEKLSKSL